MTEAMITAGWAADYVLLRDSLLRKSMNTSTTRAIAIGCAAGVALGVLFRILASAHGPVPELIAVMSISFVVLAPFVIGFVAIYLAENAAPIRWWHWVLLPWLPIVICCAITMAFLIEGSICIAMYMPIAMVQASIGGVLGGYLVWRKRRRNEAGPPPAVMMCVVFLPLLFNPLEERLLGRAEIRTVENTIEIQSPPQRVWKNIERVPLIDRSELPHAWSRDIGFPAPLEATLSHEGLGGVRHATFAGGVLFIETVDEWDAEKKLGFSIKAQTEQIPATTLDEHVRIGGPYFDMLHGEYEIERLSADRVRLHLRSQHRVSTTLNFYARLWTSAVMSDLQRSILVVIKDRCERRN